MKGVLPYLEKDYVRWNQEETQSNRSSKIYLTQTLAFASMLSIELVQITSWTLQCSFWIRSKMHLPRSSAKVASLAVIFLSILSVGYGCYRSIQKALEYQNVAQKAKLEQQAIEWRSEAVKHLSSEIQKFIDSDETSPESELIDNLHKVKHREDIQQACLLIFEKLSNWNANNFPKFIEIFNCIIPHEKREVIRLQQDIRQLAQRIREISPLDDVNVAELKQIKEEVDSLAIQYELDPFFSLTI